MPDTAAWDLLVARDDLHRTELVPRERVKPAEGEVVLRCERVGLTANNVTYAVVGDTMRYWQFFPAADGWGRVPLWGFAEVESSTVSDLVPGQRVYGYLPTSSHLVVRPGAVEARGFRDISEHRAALPAPYNLYALTTGDPAYTLEHEDLQVLYRPLFITSFMLDDYLSDNDWFGAATVVVSSASSKTAYGAAFLLSERESRPQIVGLTSQDNREFTESLGCYDAVWSYDDVERLDPTHPTAYVDVSGNADLRAQLRAQLGDRLVRDTIVGAAHHDRLGEGGADLTSSSGGLRPTFFFAPDQIAKRGVDWGRHGVEERFGAAWRRFVPFVEQHVDVVHGSGPEGLREVWLEVLSGGSAPRTGHVVVL